VIAGIHGQHDGKWCRWRECFRTNRVRWFRSERALNSFLIRKEVDIRLAIFTSLDNREVIGTNLRFVGVVHVRYIKVLGR
jgi:hypothetical protein